MKLILVLCLVAAAAAAPPVSNPQAAQIVKYVSEQAGDGNFKYEFETDDGNRAEAVGEYHPGNGKDNEGYVAVRGSYEYVGADGVTYKANYVADENGYRAHYDQGPNGVIPVEVINNLASP